MNNKNKVTHFSNIGKEKEYDSIMIECKDTVIDLKSPVCITLYNTKTNEWLSGLMVITTMKDALQDTRKKVAKDDNVQKYLEKYYNKKGESK